MVPYQNRKRHRGHTQIEADARAPASGPPKPCSEVTARQFCPLILAWAECGMGQRPLGACKPGAQGAAHCWLMYKQQA